MIITSRAVVPVSVCDLRIVIGNRNLSGRVVYLGLIVVITVDANLLPPSIPVPTMSSKQYKVGDLIELFTLDDDHQLVQKRTAISAINGIVTRQCSPPRYRITNTEGISVLDCPYSNGGLLIDPDDKSIAALWMTVGSQNSSGKNTTWKAGLSYELYIQPIIEALQRGEELENRCCGWEFEHMQLATAMNLGLSEHYAQHIVAISKAAGAVPRPVFVSGKLRPPTQGDDDLKIGDVVLAIDGTPVGRMADVRGLALVSEAKILVLRNGQELEIAIHPSPVRSQSTPKIACWTGAVVHETHNSVLEQTTPEFVRVSKREGITHPEKLVFISSIMYGSPAINNLRPVQWILEIDGKKIRSLDDMIGVIKELKEKEEEAEYIRVRLMGRRGITSVVSVKLDSKFWPAWILERKGEKWVREQLE
jgi:pro-apoptotic serine protease NMA111